MHPIPGFVIRVMDRIGYLLFKIPHRPIDTHSIKKIVVIEPGVIGDFMMSVPAFSALRRVFPDAHITLIGMPFMQELINIFQYFDRFIPYKHLFRRLRCSPPLEKIDLRQEANIIRQLKKEGVDIFVDLEGDPVDIFISFLSGIKHRIGRNTGGGGFLLTDVAKHGNSKNEVELTLDVIRMLGEVKYPLGDFEININTNLREKVRSILANHGVHNDDFVIVIMFGASWKWRAWAPERFAELSNKLLDSSDVKIITIGSNKEKEVASAINNMAGKRIIDLTGETNLAETLAVIERANLVIGNESSGIHMAALFKKPLIQLFGPGEPDKFAYFYNGCILFHYKNCKYYPCSQRRCWNREDWCMNKIKVDEVLEGIHKLLLKDLR